MQGRKNATIRLLLTIPPHLTSMVIAEDTEGLFTRGLESVDYVREEKGYNRATLYASSIFDIDDDRTTSRRLIRTHPQKNRQISPASQQTHTTSLDEAS